MRKILILIIFLYILVLLQTSFLPYFYIFGLLPNLVLITVILINLFEKQQENLGIFSAFIGGFFLDIFSKGFLGINFIGFNILILLGIAIFIKFILKSYVRWIRDSSLISINFQFISMFEFRLSNPVRNCI